MLENYARNMLKIWYISTNTFVVSENIPFSTEALLIWLMSAIFGQKINIFCQNGTFTQSNSMRAV